MSDLDGELSNVNPALLALCQDPEVWREQRRRAMRERIYGQKTAHSSTDSTAAVPPQTYMPRESAVDSTHAGPSNNTASHGAARSQSEREAYVLQQILSRKRTREQEQQQQPTHSTAAVGQDPSSEPTPSMKDRILQKYKK